MRVSKSTPLSKQGRGTMKQGRMGGGSQESAVSYRGTKWCSLSRSVDLVRFEGKCCPGAAATRQ